MTPEQKAAFIQAQTACMLAELEAMKARNTQNKINGYFPAHGPQEFQDLPLKYGLHHNAVVSFFQE